MIQKSYDESPSLYLISTPIGNLEDITYRAINTIKFVDFILCEDTRETGKLLANYNIKKKLVCCHEFNEEKIKSHVIDCLKAGQNIGLITDQGTPIISDPGYIIAREVVKNNYNVISLPGPTAFVPALTSSGISPSPFLFYGFLNSKKSKQIKELESLKQFRFSIIFYESVHRIKDTLENILFVFGDRNISLNREISKVHEEIIRGKISDILNKLDILKGEFVIVVEGNYETPDYSDLSIYDHVISYVEDGFLEKEAIKNVARDRNMSKSEVYKEYHIRKE